MRIARTFLVVTIAACGSAHAPSPSGGDDVVDPPGPDAGVTPPDPEKTPLELYDGAVGCDPAAVAKLRTALDAREGKGPFWDGGRALFRSTAATSIAGDWNNWVAGALVTAPLCEQPDLVIAVGDVPTGYHQYKHTANDVWSLDPTNPAFAYDDFSGNADGKNSVLNTYDSGRGHVIRLDRACSTALSNCRDVTAYLPPGYAAPENAAKTYPVIFFHDGQNVWSDHDCCFGHTGWEVDATLDAEIAAHHVAPVIAIAADNTTARNDEYGLDVPTMMKFMTFQVTELQPHALAQVRGDTTHVFVAGSSLGGLVSMELALRYPQTYAGAASLSGAFWPNMETHEALRDHLGQIGKEPLALYVDHGGSAANNSDGAADSIEIRDMLVGLGWQRGDSPACEAPGPNALCYFTQPGATHDELAWKDRIWRALRFLAPAQ